MSNIKVIDINEEAKQEVEPIQNEEATEQIEHEPTNEVVDNPPVEEVDASPEARELRDVKLANSSHELRDKTKEEPKQEEQPKPKPKPKPKPSDRVDCKTCGKNLSYKNYRYRHEKICTAEPKPVKPQAKPKPKAQPKPQQKIENTIEKQEVVELPTPQATQPQLTPYEIARQSYIQMKEAHRARKNEKINMFKSKMF